MNEYIKKWVDKIKKANTDKKLGEIIDKIYQDGFEDGTNEGIKK